MLITKTQLAGLAMMAGLTFAAATGCRKDRVNPVNAEKHRQKPVDSTATYGSGDEDGPKFPPHYAERDTQLVDAEDSLKTALSGDEDGPKFPPH